MYRNSASAAKRAALARNLAAIQRAHALYGLDENDEPLSGWWTDFKRKSSKVGSSIIGAAKSSGIPVVSQIASGIRAGGQVAEESGLVPSFFRTKSGASPAPVTEFVPASSGLPTWALPAGLAAVVVVLLAKR